MNRDVAFKYLLDIIRIFRPNQRVWIVRIFITSGIGLITHRFWEPWLEAFIKKQLDISIAYTDVPGWILISIGLIIFFTNSYFDRKSKKEPRFSEDVKTFNFSLGGGGINIGYGKEQLQAGANEPFNFGGHSPVKVYIEEGNLYADVEVYQGAGLPSIKIIKNKLIDKPHNWDKNSNETALEIVDDKYRPIYQFIYKTPEHIVVNGIFPSPAGLILANDNGMVLNPTLPTTFKLERIFNYPSWKYPGEYDTRSN